MKISELIQQLTVLQTEHGDVQVALLGDDNGLEYFVVEYVQERNFAVIFPD